MSFCATDRLESLHVDGLHSVARVLGSAKNAGRAGYWMGTLISLKKLVLATSISI